MENIWNDNIIWDDNITWNVIIKYLFKNVCLDVTPACSKQLGHKKAISFLGYPIASKLEDQLAFVRFSGDSYTPDFMI